MVMKEFNFRNIDLSGADLTGTDLGGANLTGANLTDADLTDADLTDADLTDARLSGVKGPLQVCKKSEHPYFVSKGAFEKALKNGIIREVVKEQDAPSENTYVVWRMGNRYHPDGEEGAYLSTIVTKVRVYYYCDCFVKLRNGCSSVEIQRAKGGHGDCNRSSHGWLYVFKNQDNV
eukprot:g328.t1